MNLAFGSKFRVQISPCSDYDCIVLAIVHLLCKISWDL